ncbi:staphylokinase domain-containing protein [Staphylococcus aureus]|uniref:staphylokinase domain-containing protein n=2 Tax=Staphylococcus aureus TaxID=1280 RepID=UPI001231D09F|nr:staphylokinase domain-containing protein [Staphylococcus aureus]QER29564.1 hypothetical protein F2X76_01225 [Staphylococcus aureus]
MLKRSLLFLTVLLLLFSFSSITNEVSASSSFDKGKYKKGDDASYFEPTGPYLMVNVTGVDSKGNELLSPHYVEFPIKPGTTLTKEKIEYYVEWALDATAYKEFRVVELDPSAKIEVTYYDKNKKKEETKSFPITEKGFVVPDLSEHTFLSCPVGYQFQPGGYCDYTEVMLQDGHVWVGYTWEGQRYYLPIRTWNGSAPPNQILGDLWGEIS